MGRLYVLLQPLLLGLQLAASAPPPPPTRASSSDTPPAQAPASGAASRPRSPQPQHTALPLSAAALQAGALLFRALGRGWGGGQRLLGSAPRMALRGHQGLLPPDLVCTGGLGGQEGRDGRQSPNPARHLRMSPSHRVSPLGSALSLTSTIVRQSPSASLLPCPPTLPTEP